MTESSSPNLLRRAIGILLLVTAVAGLILSLWSVAWVWRVRGPFTERVLTDLALVQDTVQTTSDGLELTGDSLVRVKRSLMSIETSLNTLGDSAHEIEPLLATLRIFADRDIPDTIAATQTSLAAAQSSAEIIDGVLTALTAIPFFPGAPYAPELPLHVALADVSENLDDIPDSLGNMADDLQKTESNLVDLRLQLRLVTRTVSGLQDDIDQAQQIVIAYEATLMDLSERLEMAEQNLDRWMTNAARAATVILAWVALTQVGLLINALGMLEVYL